MQKKDYIFLIDLDNTLYYDIDTDFSNKMSKNIQNFMVSKLDIDINKISEKQQYLYKTYGNSLTGLLEEGYKINFDEWYNKIHSILPYDIIKENTKLYRVLEQITLNYGRCIIFTNADRIHTIKVLEKLGLYEFFTNGINDIITFDCLNTPDTTKILCKPHINAFNFVLNKLNILDTSKVIFIDDSICNIKTAYNMGIKTIHVTSYGIIKEADLTLSKLETITMEDINRIL